MFVVVVVVWFCCSSWLAFLILTYYSYLMHRFLLHWVICFGGYLIVHTEFFEKDLGFFGIRKNNFWVFLSVPHLVDNYAKIVDGRGRNLMCHRTLPSRLVQFNSERFACSGHPDYFWITACILIFQSVVVDDYFLIEMKVVVLCLFSTMLWSWNCSSYLCSSCWWIQIVIQLRKFKLQYWLILKCLWFSTPGCANPLLVPHWMIQLNFDVEQGGSLMCVRTWCSDPSSSTFLTKMSTKSRDNKNRCLSLKQSLHILSTNWITNAMLHYSTNVTWHWRD